MGAPSERFFSELIDLVVNSFGASGRAGMTTSNVRCQPGRRHRHIHDRMEKLDKNEKIRWGLLVRQVA